MYCPTCQSPNEKNAQFCKSCGTKLYHPQHEQTSSNGGADKLLIIFFVVAFIVIIAQSAINIFFDGWRDLPIKYFYYALNILLNISFVLPALAIKNKTLKIIGIILASLLIITKVYGSILILTI